MQGEFILRSCFEDKDGNKFNYHEFGENVYGHSSCYQKIFGTKLKYTNREKRYIKISSVGGKISIYRILRGVPSGISSKSSILYINGDGKNILEEQCKSKTDDSSVVLIIKPVSSLRYFWCSSNVYNRISFQVALCSLILSTLSIIFSLTFL